MAEDPTNSKTPKSARMDTNTNGHPLFGDLVETFPQYRFPTFLQVLNRVRFLKSIQQNRLDSLRPIYNVVANELSSIWTEAFVVPVPTNQNLATRLEREIEKKLLNVRSNLSKIVDPKHPEKKTAQLSEMNKVFSITKCKCFLKKEHRQDVIRSNCKCDNPIVNLETYGDQLFGFNEICIFEEDKVIFTQKIAEMEAKTLPTPPPTPTEESGLYDRKYLATKRARPLSGGYKFPDDDDIDMEASVQDEVNWDPVLETMLSQGLKPFAIMKCINEMVVATRCPASYLVSESWVRRRIVQLYGENSQYLDDVASELVALGFDERKDWTKQPHPSKDVQESHITFTDERDYTGMLCLFV